MERIEELLFDGSYSLENAATLGKTAIFNLDDFVFLDSSVQLACLENACPRAIHEWVSVLDSMMEQLYASPDFKKGASQFENATSNAERVHYFTDTFDTTSIGSYFIKCKDSLLNKCLCQQKNADIASQICSAGNDEFSTKNQNWSHFLLAFQVYTYGLMFVPEGDGAAYLYGNRSAASFRLKQYENALDDIDRAFKLSFSRMKPDQVAILLSRKADCLLKLDRKVNLSKFQDPSVVIEALSIKKKFTSSQRFPWLNAKVNLFYDTEKGFQLVAKEKLEFGEVISIRKPFASLDGRVQNNRCHNCYIHFTKLYSDVQEDEHLLQLQGPILGSIRISCPIPCALCPNAIYCSEACRAEAFNSYHRFECSQYCVLTKLNHQSHLALRMLYSAGSLQNIRKVASEWENGGDPLGLIDNQRDYAFIYSMQQPEMRDLKDELRQTATACFLAKLAQLSGFVPNTIEDEEFAANILLRHLFQLKANLSPPAKETIDECADISSINGMNAMLSYSCEPNVGRSCISRRNAIQSNVNIFYTARTIQAGDALTQCYDFPSSKDFIVSQFDRRQSVLRNFNPAYQRSQLNKYSFDRSVALFNQFGIVCKCTRCMREHRDSLDLNSRNGVYYPIACETCGSLMIRAETSTDELFQCSSSSCKKMMSLSHIELFCHHVDSVDFFFHLVWAMDGRLSQLERIETVHRVLQQLQNVSPKLHQGSVYLLHLYIQFSQILTEFVTETGQLNLILLCEAYDCAEKALMVCEEMYDGRNVNNALVRNCLAITASTLGKVTRDFAKEIAREWSTENQVTSPIERYNLIASRLKAAEEATEFDSIITDLF